MQHDQLGFSLNHLGELAIELLRKLALTALWITDDAAGPALSKSVHLSYITITPTTSMLIIWPGNQVGTIPLPL